MREIVQVLDTSTEPVRVQTDAGEAYLKHPFNREGAHVLACEWLGTRLAGALGLEIFDTTRMTYDGAAPIRLTNGIAPPAECFVTRYVDGFSWSGGSDALELIDRPDDLTRLIVLDTWLRNPDRHSLRGTKIHQNESNVFLRPLPGGETYRLVAMDFSQLLMPLFPFFSPGAERVQDPNVYGLFPAFVPLLRREPIVEALNVIQGIPKMNLEAILDEIPDEWGVNSDARAASVEFLTDRAEYLGETLLPRLEREAPQQIASDVEEEKDGG